ncbi:MAG: helix-turn-helix transcriptional regulator [Candidatus Riflebacteria bacterium]|nr:helix-turn-helix transcriptional regulator [Candidatus Riflebacteria bacterium]
MDIKQLLKDRKISQTRLAELMGIPRTTVANWFNGNSKPTKYEHIVKLAKILEVDVAEINNNIEISANNQDSSSNIQGFTETDKELFKLSQEDKDFALAFIRFLHSYKKSM